jgi:hypothetical protein
LLSLHVMVAGITKTPELELDPAEAKKIAESLAQVSKLFPIGLTDKQLALSNLGITLAGVYGTRAIAIRARHMREGAGKPKPFLMKPQPQPQAQPQAAPAAVVVNGMPEPPQQRAPGAPATPSELYGPARAGVKDEFTEQ